MGSITDLSDSLGEWPDWPDGGENIPDTPPGTPPSTPPNDLPHTPPRPDPKGANSNQWTIKKVQLIDGEFNYYEAKAGNAIFVDTKNLENVNLLTPAVAQKLFPS